jgi:hypothetical protein
MRFIHFGKAGTVLAGGLLFAVCGVAQSNAHAVPQGTTPLQTYSVARESLLQGTVVAYAASSSVAPFGAHVSVRTSSGLVDIHLGNGKLLSANQVTLNAGDAVSITGENIAYGQTTVFVARLVQKGAQSVALRSQHGVPLAVFTKGNAKQGGAL